MNMQDLKNWKENKKKENAAKWNNEGAGTIGRFTQREFELSMKESNKFRKSSTTRRTHAKGNLWNHNNAPRIKADIETIFTIR